MDSPVKTPRKQAVWYAKRAWPELNACLNFNKGGKTMVDYSKPMKPVDTDTEPENYKRALMFVARMMNEIDNSINHELLVKVVSARGIERRIMKFPGGDYFSLDVLTESHPDPEGRCQINYDVVRCKESYGDDALEGVLVASGVVPVFTTGAPYTSPEELVAYYMVDCLPDQLKAPHILDYPEKDSELQL